MNNKNLINDPKRQNCQSVKAVGKSSGLGAKITKSYILNDNPKMLTNFFDKFTFGKFRFMRSIARVALQQYGQTTHKVSLYNLDEATPTLRAEWVRYLIGWELFNIGNIKTKTLILEFFNVLGHIDIVDFLSKNNVFFDRFATSVEHSFPFIIPEVEEAIHRYKKQERKKSIDNV